MIDPLQETSIVFDGECPFCSRYVAMLRIRDAIGPVTLINARNGGPVVAALRSHGYSLDEGMVLVLNGAIYHGADCIHRLALLSSDATWFNRLNAFVFRNRILSRGFYPILRSGRLAALSLLGRELMGDAQELEQPPKKPFRRYRTRMLILFLSLSVYPFIAEADSLPILKYFSTPVVREFFPFFKWALFSSPRRYSVRYTIEPVDVIENSTLASALNRPVEISEASFLRGTRFQKAAHRLERTIAIGDEAAIQVAKALVDNFVKPYGVKTYRVVRQEIDSLVRDRRVIVSVTVIAQIDTTE